MKHFLIVLLSCLLLAGISHARASSPFEVTPSAEFLSVEEAYQLSLNWQNDKIEAKWAIQDGYYLYKHAFKLQLLEAGSQTTLSLDIPDGKKKYDEYFGEVEVYYQHIKLSSQPLQLEQEQTLLVISQGCADSGLCYPPQKQYFKINQQKQTIIATDKPDKLPPPQVQEGKPGGGANADQPSSTTSPDKTSGPSLIYYLLFATVGGLILNLMPCVFPVLSLKVLSFSGQADQQQQLRKHAWVYTLGVVLSFILIAAIMLVLRSTGEAIGWGFQLQNALFIGALTYLFFLMGLSLMGYVEFGGRLMGAGQNLAAKKGYSGSFFTGALAVVVASPCTAPFMSTALGYAISQPAIIALSIFAALGFGMAFPFLLFSYIPSLANRLPKPGAWMDSFKRLLAFPMFATAIWLLWVAGQQTQNQSTTSLLLGCLCLALAILFKQEPAKKAIWRTSKTIASIVSLSLAVMLLFQSDDKQQQADWVDYSETKLSELRQQKQAVFVNITADWCITCLMNEKVTLSKPSIKQAFKDNKIIYMKGDWTNYDENITALLSKYQRSGIPLYIYYPADGSQEILLPQILKADDVLNIISKNSSL